MQNKVSLFIYFFFFLFFFVGVGEGETILRTLSALTTSNPPLRRCEVCEDDLVSNRTLKEPLEKKLELTAAMLLTLLVTLMSKNKLILCIFTQIMWLFLHQLYCLFPKQFHKS